MGDHKILKLCAAAAGGIAAVGAVAMWIARRKSGTEERKFDSTMKIERLLEFENEFWSVGSPPITTLTLFKG